MKLTDNWRIFGGAEYNIEDDLFVSDHVGLSYHDECFTFSLAFNESRSDSVLETNRTFTFKLGLRTIGEYQQRVSDEQLQDFGDNQNN